MDKEYILSLSYGKDSMACLGAIEKLGLPLTRIITVDVWATDTIPADLPPVVEFKAKADKIIKERYGIDVEHFCAEKNGEKWTYEKEFYHIPNRKPTQSWAGLIRGFPLLLRPWCNSTLKMSAINKANKEFGENVINYVGIALDESKRIERLANKPNKIMPLVQAGWTEADCRKWCEQNDLLSPIYQYFNRGGCWFCQNQCVKELRLLRKNYPDLWEMLLKWSKDSPSTFRADGHTVYDFDKRFEAEDKDIINPKARFKWDMLNF